MRITLPEELPPLRMLLVWDNLAGHLNAELLLLMFARGIMVLYTPLGGSWLNMSESIQRILVSRALCGEHPRQPEQIIEWLEAAARGWNRDPTPFEWGGRRAKRRARARERGLGTDGMPYMPWEVAEPVRGGRYEGGGASWRNGDTRVKQPTSQHAAFSRRLVSFSAKGIRGRCPERHPPSQCAKSLQIENLRLNS